MPSTLVPICPFISASGEMKPCLDNCPLNINGECSIRIIAENLKSSTPSADCDE